MMTPGVLVLLAVLAAIGAGFWRIVAGIALAVVFFVLLVGVVSLTMVGHGDPTWTQVN